MNRTIVAAGLAIALVMASLPLSHAAGERDGVTFDSADEVSRETREVEFIDSATGELVRTEETVVEYQISPNRDGSSNDLTTASVAEAAACSVTFTVGTPYTVNVSGVRHVKGYGTVYYPSQSGCPGISWRVCLQKKVGSEITGLLSCSAWKTTYPGNPQMRADSIRPCRSSSYTNYWRSRFDGASTIASSWKGISNCA